MTFTIIRGGLVLDVAGRTVQPADILIDGDRIAEVGAPGLVAPDDARVVNAEDRLVIPGLVNSHTHGHGSLGKGLGDKWSLELLLNAAPWVSGGFTLEDKKLAAQLNAAEMVLKGCTAAYDLYFEFPTPSVEGLNAIVDGYAEVGVRVVLAPMMADTTLFDAIPGLLDALPETHREHVANMKAAPADAHLQACATMVADWTHDLLRARPALGPTIPLHCTDNFIRGCRDLASDFDLPVQMHLGESKVQALSGITKYGKTLTAHLDSLGLLTPRFTGAHGVWLDGDDMRRLADNGSSIAHNPGSNLRLGSGIAPVFEMMEAGVGVGIGTDGSASSDNQNMFEAMRAAAFVSRVMTPDPETWIGTWEALELGTVGGARVLGMADDIGQIGPGFKADLVFLDLANVNFVPLNDAANQIINCEDSSAVHSVMIDGAMVLRARRFTQFDYDSLRRKTQSAAERLTVHNTATRQRMDVIAQYVSSHCVGLACQSYHVERRIDGHANSQP